MAKTRRWLLPALALMAWIAAVAWSAPAAAHEFRPALLDVRSGADGIVTMRWTPPAMTSRGPVTDALRPRLPAHCEPVPPGLGHYDCGHEGLAGRLSVRGLSAHPTDVLVTVTHGDGRQVRGRLSPRTPSMPLQAGAPVDSTVAAVSAYLELGARHIAGGIDHLLLVLGLLLLVPRARPLLAAVTGFTIGHCVTLALVVLGGVSLPGPPVEAAIALSIVFIAVEIRRGPPSLAHRHPGLVGIGIGLLHGLGFAGALMEIGLPAEHVTAALVGFNLGVEAGQLAVVLAACAVGAVVVRRVELERVRRGLAWGLGLVAAAWTLMRCLELGGAA